ncbi:MAG TPA: rod shape-determining protein MreD [Parasegetibacter sp.]|jgi:rod shape-determining protein MreD
MSELLKNIIRYILFIFIQVFVLNNIPPLHQFIVPYLYFLFILWLPFNMKRGWLMVVAFLFGFSLDAFTKTPGLHAAACVLIAYIRPFIISLLVSRDMAELNYVSPSAKSLGWVPYITYVLVLTLLHHTYLVFLEWMQFGSFIYFMGKVLATTAVSFVLVMLVEMLFPRDQRYRTNTA